MANIILCLLFFEAFSPYWTQLENQLSLSIQVNIFSQSVMDNNTPAAGTWCQLTSVLSSHNSQNPALEVTLIQISLWKIILHLTVLSTQNKNSIHLRSSIHLMTIHPSEIKSESDSETEEFNRTNFNQIVLNPRTVISSLLALSLAWGYAMMISSIWAEVIWPGLREGRE